MLLDPAKMPPRDFYRHMISAIAPRPIAWVSTLSPGGVPNLAPFSFFNGVGANPPAVVFCPTNNRNGTRKDTIVNVEATRQFVVNTVPYHLAEKMNATSAELPYETCEFTACGLTQVASTIVKPPGVAESPIRMECELLQVVNVGEGPLASHVVIGRIVMMHVDEAVMDVSGQIDQAKLALIGRMGGSLYCRTSDRFSMERPT